MSLNVFSTRSRIDLHYQVSGLVLGYTATAYEQNEAAHEQTTKTRCA